MKPKDLKKKLEELYDKLNDGCESNDYSDCFTFIEIEKYKFMLKKSGDLLNKKENDKYYSLLSRLTTKCLQCKMALEEKIKTEGGKSIDEIVSDRNLRLKICLNDYAASFE